jgi:hypothetical protein
MQEARCGHLICNFLNASQFDKTFSGEPSADKYTRVVSTDCRIGEPAPGTMKPHFREESSEEAAHYIAHLDPEKVQIELDRLRMRHAAMALAKHLRSEPGSLRDLLVHLRKQPGQSSESIDRLEALGMAVADKK